jgi:glutathione peroxidase
MYTKLDREPFQEPTMSKIHEFTVPALGKGEIRLADHVGKVLLLVNTASECGLTPQYEGLEALHKRYASKGLVVIGFPCNQFGHQEPGNSDVIANFCQKNYGVTFPLSQKIEVNGSFAHPLWKHLKEEKRGFLWRKAIKWNFTKFLVDRKGNVVKRFSPASKPEKIGPEIEKLI